MGFRTIIFTLSFYILVIVLSGCASSTTDTYEDVDYPVVMREPQSYDENSKARGSAYVTDAIHVRRPMPSRPTWKPLEFYFKHCSQVSPKTHTSKTSYECSGPY